MNHLARAWRAIPSQIRKPFVFAIGLVFIIAAAATGWLPGPGGIPLFIIGITILATEFVWAAQVQDLVLKLVEEAGLWLRRHAVVGPAIIACGVWLWLCIAYAFIS